MQKYGPFYDIILSEEKDKEQIEQMGNTNFNPTISVITLHINDINIMIENKIARSDNKKLTICCLKRHL